MVSDVIPTLDEMAELFDRELTFGPRRDILQYILTQSDDFVEEPLIRDFLKEKWDITSPKTVRSNLTTLEAYGILEKEKRRGKPNRWYIVYKSRYLISYLVLILVHLIRLSHEKLEGEQELHQVLKSDCYKDIISSKLMRDTIDEYISNYFENEDIIKNDPKFRQCQIMYNEAIQIFPQLVIEIGTLSRGNKFVSLAEYQTGTKEYLELRKGIPYLELIASIQQTDVSCYIDEEHEQKMNEYKERWSKVLNPRINYYHKALLFPYSE